MPPEEEQKVSKSETRRGSKPLVEKKRRARINRSLNELQNLVLSNKMKKGYKQSRIEKADILEMAVRYLERIQKQRKEANTSASSQYRDGYLGCVSEVTRYLATVEKVNVSLQDRLRSHLEQSLERVQPETDRKSNLDDEDSSSDSSTVTSTTTSPSSSPSPPKMTSRYRAKILTRPAIAPAGPRVTRTETLAVPSRLTSGHLSYEIPPNSYLWYTGQPDSSVNRDLPEAATPERSILMMASSVGSSVKSSLSPGYLSREGTRGSPDFLCREAMCPSGGKNARDSAFGDMWRPW